MLAVQVRRYLSSDAALSVAAAEAIFTDLRAQIEKGAPVAADFDGVRNATTVFLNTAVGQLYGSFGNDKLEGLLTFRNAAPLVERMLRMTIQNAKLFYSQPASSASQEDEDWN